MMNGEPIVHIEVLGKEYEYTVKAFIEKFLWIVDKRSKLVPFKMNRSQELLYKEICEQRAKGEPVRIIIDKSRQQGISTFVAAFLFSLCVTTPFVNYAVIADSLSHAENLFNMYQRFWANMLRGTPVFDEIARYEADNPGKIHRLDWRPQVAQVRQGRVLKFQGLESAIRVVVAGDAAGRSATFQGVHGSEVAFWKSLEDTMTGLSSTVPESEDTYIFLESTANGFNEFKERWDEAVAGRNGYKAVFLPWYKDPTATWKVEKWWSPSQLDEWLLEKWREYPSIRDDQMRYYERRYLDMGRNKERVLQEYPFSDVDSFRATGQSIFNREQIAKRLNAVKAEGAPIKGRFAFKKDFSSDGRTIELQYLGFKKYEEGEWRIYKEPTDGRPYILCCDPNAGGIDDTAIQVIDAITCEQVAVMQSQSMQLDDVAFQLVCAGYYYNTGLIASEMNVSPIVMDYALRCEYPRIGYRQVTEAERSTLSPTQQRGYKTTMLNRQGMIDELKIAFSANPQLVKDEATLREMERFEIVIVSGEGRPKAAAAKGFHDDLVMALMACHYIRGTMQPDFDCVVDKERYRNPWKKELKSSQKSKVVGGGFDWRKAIW